jgi:hypothetical protein
MQQGMIKLGPWGGPGGSQWSQWGDSTVRRMIIAHGWAIDSILFMTNNDGKDEWSKRIGGSGGTARDQVMCFFHGIVSKN